jgi:hypothetical protein
VKTISSVFCDEYAGKKEQWQQFSIPAPNDAYFLILAV